VGIVKYIFGLFIEAGSYAAVADDLNRKKVNPPYVYRKTGEVFFTSGSGEYQGWNKGAVERILKSETYTGKLVQGKSSITARDERNRIRKAEEEWVVKENTHEPVIDAALFAEAEKVRDRIHEKMKSRSNRAERCQIGENILDKAISCSVCGKKMTRRPDGAEIRANIRKVERDIAAAMEEEQIKYMEYREKMITPNEYAAFKMRREGRLKDLNRQKEALEVQLTYRDELPEGVSWNG